MSDDWIGDWSGAATQLLQDPGAIREAIQHLRVMLTRRWSIAIDAAHEIGTAWAEIDSQRLWIRAPYRYHPTGLKRAGRDIVRSGVIRANGGTAQVADRGRLARGVVTRQVTGKTTH